VKREGWRVGTGRALVPELGWVGGWGVRGVKSI